MPRKKYEGCSVEGCERKHYALSYCRNHYDKNRTYGQPVKPEKEKTFCHCGNPVFNHSRQLCRAHYQQWWYNNRLGNSQGIWRKDEVGYAGAHGRIATVRGKASGYQCVLCTETASDWALSADATDLRFGHISGREDVTAYSLDVYSYLPMCSDCHKAYDTEHANRAFKVRQSRWEVDA